jgi:hypothetical protein
MILVVGLSTTLIIPFIINNKKLQRILFWSDCYGESEY